MSIRREVTKSIRFNEIELYMLRQIMKLTGVNTISEAVRESVRFYYMYLIRRYKDGTLYRLKEYAERRLEDKEVQK